MKRVPEPELMEDEEQAIAYAQGNFAEAHQRLVDLIGELLPNRPRQGRAVDLGCGPGDMLCRFARAHPGYQIDAVDGSAAMVRLAREAVAADPQLAGRVHVQVGRIPDVSLPHPTYDLIFSNSLLHHLPDPGVLWKVIQQYCGRQTWIFVSDLRRPASWEAIDRIVQKYAATDPPILQRDFRNSLAAAFTVPEVQAQLEENGLTELTVRPIGDRHLVVYGVIRRKSD